MIRILRRIKLNIDVSNKQKKTGWRQIEMYGI